MGRKEEAEAAYQRGIAARPMAWNGYNHLGTFYYRQRRLAEAEARFRKGLTLTPDNPALLNNLGNTLKNQGRMKEAAEMFERSLEIEPNYISYQNFGTFYYRQGEFAKSARLFEKALALNPKDFRVWGSLGTALVRSGGTAERQREVFGKAAELGEKLVAAMPSKAENRSLVAEYQARLGEKEKARRHLAAITPGSSEDAEVWLRVAMVRVLLGEREEAERALKMAGRYGATQGDVARDAELSLLGSLLPKAGNKSEAMEQGEKK
jgi:tetratricopeptide (TPR) repeat protein